MTKVSQLFEEEKIEAVNQAVIAKTIEIAKKMLSDGLDYLKVMSLTGLPKKDVLKIQSELKTELPND